MNVVTALIISNVALVLAIALIILLTVAWLKAEYNYYRIGGKSKWFRAPKGKGGKR